jgi:hypothetical protein
LTLRKVVPAAGARGEPQANVNLCGGVSPVEVNHQLRKGETVNQDDALPNASNPNRHQIGAAAYAAPRSVNAIMTH